MKMKMLVLFLLCFLSGTTFASAIFAVNSSAYTNSLNDQITAQAWVNHLNTRGSYVYVKIFRHSDTWWNKSFRVKTWIVYIDTSGHIQRDYMGDIYLNRDKKTATHGCDVPYIHKIVRFDYGVSWAIP